MLEAILWLVFASVALVFITWLVGYLRAYRHLKRYPAPPIWPIIGNALEFKSSADLLDHVLSLFRKYKTKVLRLNLGPRNALLITDYKFLEFLLSSQKILHKSQGYEFIQPWLGTGLLTSAGEKWRKRRKTITPSFHFQILEQFVDIFHKSSEIMVKKMKKEVGKGSTDIYPYVTLCALDSICETAMGISINAQEENYPDYVRSVKNMCRITLERSSNAFYHYDFFYKFSKNYKTQVESLKILHGFTDSVIKRRRKELEGKTIVEQADESGVKKRVAFLDMLLQAEIDGQPLSDGDIREEVDTFMFEGHDTTASAIAFALFSLANHPEIQRKVFDEIKTIFKDDRDRGATFRDLQEMKYLEMVIKETLRLYPSVPLYIRRTHEEIKYGDLTIPKYCALSIFAYGIHRDPEHFPNPLVFDPERFAVGSQQGRLPYAYIPFSAGPRNCIGQKFAILEMKSTISKVLRSYELKAVVPEHKLILLAETVLKSANGVLIGIEERNWN